MSYDKVSVDEYQRLYAENERLRADKDVWGEAHEVACRRAEQAEREGQRLSDVATFQLDRAEKLQAEVERLKGELNEAKEEVRRQVEMRMLDQGRHHVDLQEASGQIAPESLCSCGETLRELEAALAQAERERDEARAERNARAKRRTLEGRNG